MQKLQFKPVKILYIIESLGPGGKERRLVQLLLWLLDAGNFEIEIVLTSDRIHYTEIKKSGVQIHQIDKSPGHIFGFIQFWRIANRFEPDIIHTWGGLITITTIPFALLKRVPIIDGQVTANTQISTLNLIFFYHLPFLFSKVITTNSKKAINVYKIPKRKVRCIYNGFDFKRLANLKDNMLIRQALGVNTNYLVGMVASFVPLKDYSTYVKAALCVLEKFTDIAFLAIGRGNSHPYIEMIPNRLKHHFIFMDAQLNIEDYMNACDIGVLSSFMEGLPNVVIEFMALGKPVIASKVGGIPEVIDHGIDGFLFEVENEVELSNFILKIIKNNQIQEIVGLKAKQKVKDKFSMDRMLSEYKDLYKKIISDS